MLGATISVSTNDHAKIAFKILKMKSFDGLPAENNLQPEINLFIQNYLKSIYVISLIVR